MTEDEKNALGFLAGRLDGVDAQVIRKACKVLQYTWPPETLAPLCISYWQASAEVRQIVEPTLLDLAAKLPAHLWLSIDKAIRKDWNPRSPLSIGKSSTSAASVLVALCHPSGQIRERAATMTGVLPPLLAASLLLVRANDWADPVRTVATSALESGLDRLSPAEKMAVTPLVARLRTCGRFAGWWNHRTDQERESAQIERWFDRLAASFNPEAWRKLWMSSRGAERRIYLELLQRSKIKPGPRLRQDLFGNNDRAALAWYIREILPGLEEGERFEAAEAIARSRAVPVRRFWLAAQMEANPQAAIKELIDTLTNRSRSLRHFARYHLTRLAPMDFASHYQVALGDSFLEPWALRGLAEISPTAAHQEAVSRLQSPDAKIRTAAIECLDAEALGDFMEVFFHEIQMPGTGPARAARKRLTGIAQLVGLELVASPERFFTMSPAAREHLLLIAPFYRKWHGLEVLLRAAADPTDFRLAKKKVRIWLSSEGRSFVRLSAPKQDELLRLLDASRLPDDLRKQLRYVLEHAER